MCKTVPEGKQKNSSILHAHVRKITLPRTFFVCDTPLVQHFEVFDFHLSLLSTIPGAMAQISPCQPQTQEDRKMLAKIQGIHANPKLTLKVVDVGIVKHMLVLL